MECLQRATDGQDGLTPKGTSLAERANTECLCKACQSLSFAPSVRATRHSPRSASPQLITTEQPSSPQPRTTTCTKQSPGNWEAYYRNAFPLLHLPEAFDLACTKTAVDKALQSGFKRKMPIFEPRGFHLSTIKNITIYESSNDRRFLKSGMVISDF